MEPDGSGAREPVAGAVERQAPESMSPEIRRDDATLMHRLDQKYNGYTISMGSSRRWTSSS